MLTCYCLQQNFIKTFLIDNRKSTEVPLQKDAGGDDWSLVRNQIFVGLLGSSVSPRKEIIHLIETSTKAGIRFVYFSPRNMRRCKELASQMGIEMSWNCEFICHLYYHIFITRE